MSEQTTVRVRYVGLKDKEQDTVARTDIWWVGIGDIKEVPASAWPILAKHPDVWELVEDPQPVESAAEAEADEFAGMTTEQMQDIAQERGLKIHKNLRGENLRARLRELTKV